ncbi:TIGR00282 family metallophosphoesterase [Phycisphaera mikurensis]|uniref:YmdB family metallophosphoesterase n=1 Tax=Phycisphaera mikurensis (strain NBRC 102666 / KCTC 22515 / FYK2301M01) TaxID=1142394 RepID=I0IDE4_PHYMF|nr:TIGR00282 family metallophosphoesterase [Phycisphaera mikurensis]MBB6443332.1 hypothetical protein [Phycisphaera mikurensis]BAM03282.1 hypothetical protein PSMK_11230 [Phycisphaera mikurensis NBRC 102666]
MRIAFLGDVVGAPGRRALLQCLPDLRGPRRVDVVLANVENTASGSGLLPDQHKRFAEAGVDGMTLGDHAFRKNKIRSALESADDLIRPFNLPGTAWGRGAMTLRKPGLPAVHVITLMGRLFMNGPQAGDPFAALDGWLERLHAQHRDGPPPVIVVEIHAEATSEKVALGWHANGRVAAVVGTHTHVPTADARVLPRPGPDPTIPGDVRPGVGGTAYVTDLGMTGPDDSCLGRRVDRVLSFMTRCVPSPFDVAEGNPHAHGVLIDVDETTGLATAIERYDVAADVGAAPFV